MNFYVGQKVYYEEHKIRHYGIITRIVDPFTIGVNNWYKVYTDWKMIYATWDAETTETGWMPSHKVISCVVGYKVDQEPLDEEEVL